MNVNVVLFEELRIDSVLSGIALDIAYGDRGTFLHDVTELSGNDQTALAVKICYFYRQDVAAKLGISQTGGYAYLVFIFLLTVFIDFLAEPLLDQFLRNLDILLLTLGDGQCRLTA